MWVRLCLGTVFPGPVCSLVKFWRGGSKELTDGNAQSSQSLPSFCRESLEHGPGTSLISSGIFNGEKSVLVWHCKLGFKNSSPNPAFRLRCSDLWRHLGSKRALLERKQGHPGSPEHHPQKQGAKSSAETCSMRRPCQALSFLSWGCWGFGVPNLEAAKRHKK